MIDPELLLKVRVVYCHRNRETPCADGVASALLLRDALPQAEIRFVEYGFELDTLSPHDRALFCDICPPERTAPDWMRAGAIVLDHHATRAPITRKFAEAGRGAYGDEPGVSGAVLAYREVWFPLRYPDGEVPGRRHAVVERFARLAGVYDTWQRESPEWPDADAQTEALRFWPWSSYPKDGFSLGMSRELGNMLNLGYVLVEKRKERTKYIAANGHRAITSSGTKVLIVSSRETDLVLDFVEGYDAVVGFGFSARDRPTMTFSVRSRKDFDAGAFAKANGGGGHRGSAGFERELSDDDPSPYELVLRLLEAWELSE